MGECDFKVTIIGLGLIGASYAKALKKLDFKTVWGVDLSSEVLSKAEKYGIIDEGFLKPENALEASDIVIIALYPKATLNFVKKYKEHFRKNSIITDTAGLKASIVSEIQEILPENVEFVGGHPMAGKEGKGLEMSSEAIFEGANYIITPSEKNKAESLEFIEQLAYRMGCGKVITMSPEEHDKIIAYTSQLTHALAVSMVNCCEADVKAFIGNGFKDLTRIAINNSSLWSELLIENRENLIGKIGDFQRELEEIKRALIKQDENYIREKFEKANIKRKGL